ncbi:MAG: pentapeptide repeat-containing protein [Methanocorpusculum sp.]|nr:pentapeptide repeat-containing protein [Methanocorpusculum sp.]
MVEGPEGWNKELYDKLSFDFLIDCAQYLGIEEWNKEYDKYLKSEWDRIFPGVEYDPENKGKLFEYESGFQRPNYNKKDFTDAIQKGANFINAHLEGANFFWAHLNGVNFICTHLERANFTGAHLDGADLTEAILERADFMEAHLNGVNFLCAHLKRANFLNAHLEGANFLWADLKGATLKYAIVNGETLFNKNIIDDKTDFTGTSLSSARIDPELRTRLERNIRQIRWEEWYNDNKMLEIPAKVFWKISDYGSSTLSILFTFLFSNVIFTMFYLALRDADLLHGTILSSGNDLLLAYMQTTLVPFGILGIDLTTLSLFPVFIIFVQVIFGYTILAALVTRMAIMFQNLSP